MEKRDFRISKNVREFLDLKTPVFVLDDMSSLYRDALRISYKYNEKLKSEGKNNFVSAGKLHAVAVLHMLYQLVLTSCLRDGHMDYFPRRMQAARSSKEMMEALSFYDRMFPSPLFDEEKITGQARDIEDARSLFVHQIMRDNPALMKAAKPFVSPDGLVYPEGYKALMSLLSAFVKDEGRNSRIVDEDDIFTFLTRPARLYPNSLEEQIRYIIEEWTDLLPESIITLLKLSLDYIREEEKDHGFGGPPGDIPLPDYTSFMNEYEAFSSDSDWMPRVVMLAKCTLVWLDQLSKEYKRPITRLDQIPDRELDLIKERGFTALWLIGLWERSSASKRIKNLCGNPDAEASAYSLYDYDISYAIGGWEALENLRARCRMRGIRLASDMVPNHTGIDGRWVYEHPDYFVSQDWSPFPSYTYNGPDLSSNPDFEIKLEDHYYNRTDAAVTFRLVDKRNGKVRYVFHGNDGTTMPWNDTAQLDYLNPETREAVIQKIIHVAKNFPIIRFDAAMTLAKKHIRRLWYPRPGEAGDIAGRTTHAMSDKEFDERIPEEFWREVVDRIAKEVPDTLLLAEAFWLMEGYFVRTLGMHRVYNSAFMNMLKNQENAKYRLGVKQTLEYEPEILKRYVNFMNNPDEETAIAQFGDGDKYFGVATVLATLPGLPMVGHGQIEGYHEKYGMEYRRAYWDEKPNDYLIKEHYRRIFPLFKKRYLFSNVDNFQFYDCYENGNIHESVYAYANGQGSERTIVLYNNQYEAVRGNIKESVNKLVKDSDGNKKLVRTQLADNLNLTFSGKCYALFDNFSDGLTYIIPSIKLFEEGFDFSLNGYESRVFWNIREVEDSDGTYEELYNTYRTKGIKDVRTTVRLMRLRPLFALYAMISSDESVESVFDIVNGKCKKEDERALLLSIAETYAKLPEVFEELPEGVREKLKGFHELDAKKTVGEIRKLVRIFKGKGGSSLQNWSTMEKSLPLLILSYLALKPFDKVDSIRYLMESADELLLDHLFEKTIEKIQLDSDVVRLMTHGSAILLKGFEYYEEGDDGLKYISKLLKDSGVRDFVKANVYQNTTWYNQENMQLLFLIALLSLQTRTDIDVDIDKMLSDLLERENKSQYKLEEFLVN